jgi:hypothetical protein
MQAWKALLRGVLEQIGDDSRVEKETGRLWELLNKADDPDTGPAVMRLIRLESQDLLQTLRKTLFKVKWTGETVVGVDPAEPGSEGTVLSIQGETPEIRGGGHTISELGRELLGRSLVTPLMLQSRIPVDLFGSWSSRT